MSSCPEGYIDAPKDHFYDLMNAISIEDGSKPTIRVVPGFSDVMVDDVLGKGKFLNTFGTINQLCSAILLSDSPAVADVYDSPVGKDRDEVVERVTMLRDAQVLDGLRILDLGCGRPVFALAATALGATVYTADLDPIEDKPGELSESHIQVNLRDPQAAEAIEEVSGNELDVVTECIIDMLPWQTHAISAPSDSQLVSIANKLLRVGGNLTMLSGFTHNSTGYTKLEPS